MSVFRKRLFLNNETEGGTAFVEAEVQEANDTYVDANFKVADCNRVVGLTFWANNDAESLANVRQKIVKLRRAVVAFEKALIEELDVLEQQ